MSDESGEIHEHDRGLAHDLETINLQMMSRRALVLLGSAGTVGLMVGCGDGSSSAGGGGATSSSTSSTSASSASSTSSTSTSSTSSTSSGGGSACVTDPAETGGPFPADGTNSAPGLTNNVLSATGVTRSDIRSSFIGTATVAPGVLFTLTLTVVNTNAGCAPLANYPVYLWHCSATGQYSLYDVPGESWLRGVQVTNAAGQVTFTTIYPGCYAGRVPHMHFEVYNSVTGATSGSSAARKITSQFAMPTATSSTVYTTATGYGNSNNNLAGTSIANDNVFRDNTAAEIAAMTPTITGSVAAGLVGTATIGLAI
jgi:protocatechuate 3,4-dioxygenase beta subunit